MEVTIKLNDNPHFLKAVKQLAKAFNEPIKIKKQKSEFDKQLEEFYKSDEFLEAVKEVENKEVIKFKNFDEYKKAMDIANVWNPYIKDI